MIFSNRSQILSFFCLFLFTANAWVHAETLIGKIQSVRELEKGQTEITLLQGNEQEAVLLSPETSVASVIPAKRIRRGSFISILISNGRRSTNGIRGMKSVAPALQKKLGLPDIPETPEIPGQPAVLPKVKKVPSVPKVPSLKKNSEGAPKVENAEEGTAQGRRHSMPPSTEPTEEEKTLFGKADSEKSLLKSSGSTEQALPSGRVLSVESTKKGIKVELEATDGKTQKLTLHPDNFVIQTMLLSQLHKDMSVQIERSKTSKKGASTVQRVLVVESASS